MKTQHPQKKLTFIKKTIAHLNLEQMKLALAGEDIITTTDTKTGYPTAICQNSAAYTGDACLTDDCL